MSIVTALQISNYLFLDHFQTTILNKLSLSSQSGSQGQKNKEWKEVTPQKNADKTKVRYVLFITSALFYDK